MTTRAFILLALLSLASGARAQEAPAPLKLSIELGTRPLSGRVLFVNQSGSSVRVWRTGNSWADDSLFFEAISEETRRIVRRPQVYTRNFPAAIEVAPGATHAWEFDLRDGSWEIEASLTDPDAKLIARYEALDGDAAGGVGVWTGRLRSEPVAINRRRNESAATPPAVEFALRDAAFDPARLRARRAALLELLPENAVVLVAAGPRGDDTFPFRPRPDFLYLSGRQEAGLSLLVAKGRDVLFAPPRDAHHELWNGPRIAPGTALAAASGFGEVVAWDERAALLDAALAGGAPLFLSGIEVPELGLTRPPAARGAAAFIARLRQVKDAAEVALLDRAIGATCAALSETMRSIEPGQHEYEAQAVIEYLFNRRGAQRPGFASIVGSGPNSCTLHYQDNRRRMVAGDLVVMDVGAELFGYTADVTRTVPVSGRFTPRQREIYSLVLRAQEAGIAAVKPGVTLRQVDAAARAVIVQAGYGRFFPHGTSHWLGLDVHDVGAYDRPLEPGMVLTVEPGIYLPDEALGVRIEDDVVVTEDGCRLLSGGVPRDPAAIEALMAERGVGNVEVAPVPPANVPPAPAPGDEGRRFF